MKRRGGERRIVQLFQQHEETESLAREGLYNFRTRVVRLSLVFAVVVTSATRWKPWHVSIESKMQKKNIDLNGNL